MVRCGAIQLLSALCRRPITRVIPHSLEYCIDAVSVIPALLTYIKLWRSSVPVLTLRVLLSRQGVLPPHRALGDRCSGAFCSWNSTSGVRGELLFYLYPIVIMHASADEVMHRQNAARPVECHRLWRCGAAAGSGITKRSGLYWNASNPIPSIL